MTNKKSRSKNKNTKKSKERRKKLRENKKNLMYKEKITAINEHLNDYFKTFGHRGYEYNNLLLNLEKILGHDYSIFINHGDVASSARINYNLVRTKNKRLSRNRITRMLTFVSSTERASQLAKDTYHVRKIDKNIIKSIKALSALRKLENDAVPNYYASLDAISNSNVQMKFRKMFSNNLKGKKKNSKEFEESYEDIANQIKNYLKEQGEQAERIIDKLQNESLFDDYLTPITISDLLKR